MDGVKILSQVNKILRTICDSIYDSELDCWRRKKNKEIREMIGVLKITNFLKAQRIQWFGLAMIRLKPLSLRVVTEWRPVFFRDHKTKLRKIKELKITYGLILKNIYCKFFHS